MDQPVSQTKLRWFLYQIPVIEIQYQCGWHFKPKCQMTNKF